MNKKLILAGMVLVAGFVTLTAFGGKTLEQQKQEIAAAITAQLDEFRAEKQEECTMRVNEEAQRRYDEYLASQPATPATKPSTTKKRSNTSTGTTKKDPLPQTAPAKDPAMERGGAVQRGTEDVEKRGGAVQRNADPTEQKAQDVEKRGGAVKRGGGGK